MARDLDLAIRIRADTSDGARKLRNIGAELLELGRRAGLSEAELRSLAEQVDRLAEEQNLIDTFRRQRKALRDAERAMDEAQRRAQELGRELSRATDPSQRLRREFERARQEARRSAEQYRQQQIQLQRLRDTMRQAGIATRGLADHQRELNRQTRQLNDRLTQLQQRLARAGDAGERAGDSFGKTRRGIESISGSLRQARRDLLAFIAAYAGIDLARQLADTADQWASISARLRQATESQDEFNRVQAELFRLSQETRSSLAANSALYARIADSIKRMGGTSEDAIAVTETLTKLLQLQGATSQEVASATLQFSQAIASGVLRGEEFNAVYEASPKAIQTLADGLGVPVEKMRELAEAGELTADRVIGGLLRQKEAVDRAYADLPLTIGGALQQLENQWLKLIGTQDQAAGASRQVAEAIQLFAENLDAVLATAVTVGNAATIAARTVTLAVFRMASQVANALDTLTFGSIDALHAHATALTDTVNAIAEDIRQDFKDIEGAWEGVGQAAELTNEQIVAGTSRAKDSLAQAGDEAQQTGLKFDRLGQKTDTVSSALEKLGIDATRVATGLSQSFIELTAAVDNLAQSGETSAEVLNAAAGKLLSQARSAEELTAALIRLERAQRNASLSASGQERQYTAILKKINALSEAERQRVLSQSSLARAAVRYAQGQQAAIEADIRAARTKHDLAEIEARLQTLVRQGILTERQAVEIRGLLAAETERLAEAERILSQQQRRLNVEMDNGADHSGRVADNVERAGDAAGKTAREYLYLGAVVRNQFAEISQAAADMYSRLQRSFAKMLINSTDFWSDITRAQKLTQGAIDNARKSYDALIRTIQSGNLSIQNLDVLAATADKRFRILGEEKLSALREAIDDARAKLIAAQDEARRTREALSGMADRLRDELDRIEGNREAIEQRRFQRQLERIAELERQGGEAARREAEDARRLAEELHRRKLEQIRLEADAAKRRDTAAGRQDSSVTARKVEKVVRVDFGSGRKLDIPADQEQAFLEMLEQFKKVSA